jgi:predicted protein tyrosine phosphatase
MTPSARLKVLFVCSRNRWRSPTAERIYRDDARLEVRSAGLTSDANRRLSEADLAWADLVFVMDREHRALLRERYSSCDALPLVIVLDVPDEYRYMDPALQEVLRAAIDPELARFLQENE